MSSSKRKWLLFSAFLALMTVVWVGCQDFFVNPTLTSITITPDSPNLSVGGTLQLAATGNNDDGSTSNLTSKATWTSDDPTLVTVSSTGLVKGIAKTDTTGITIHASSNGIEGTTNVTVGQTQTRLTITSNPSSPISLAAVGSSTTITFTATLNGTDVTSSTNFTSNNTSVISTPSANVATIVGGVGSVTITGTDNNNHTASITIQVTQ